MIVDVRNPLELMIRGPIPGAINVPLDSIDAFFGPDATDALWKAKFDRSKPHHGDRIVFYCAAGRRSLVAAHRAQDLGFSMCVSEEGEERTRGDERRGVWRRDRSSHLRSTFFSARSVSSLDGGISGWH